LGLWAKWLEVSWRAPAGKADKPRRAGRIVKGSRAIMTGSALLLLLFFAWAPWIDDQTVHDVVFQERAWIDGTIDKRTGEVICDYRVSWAPFGRWVASCEGGYFVAFWGSII